MASLFGLSSVGSGGGRGPRGLAGRGLQSVTVLDNGDASTTLTMNYTDGTSATPVNVTLVSDDLQQLNSLSVTGPNLAEKLHVENNIGGTVFNVNTTNNTTTIANATINGTLSVPAGGAFGQTEIYSHNLDDATNILVLRNTNAVNNASRITSLNFQDPLNSKTISMNNTGNFRIDASLLPVGATIDLGSGAARFNEIFANTLNLNDGLIVSDNNPASNIILDIKNDGSAGCGFRLQANNGAVTSIVNLESGGDLTVSSNFAPSSSVTLGKNDKRWATVFANNAEITNTVTTDFLVSSVVRANNGTLAAPSYSFNSSPDTGFFMPSSSDIRVSLDGSLGWQFTNTNNVSHRDIIPSTTDDNRNLGGGSNFWSNTFSTRFRCGASGAWGPRFTFNHDISTGMFSDVADVVGLATNGATRILISDDSSTIYNNLLPNSNNTRSLGSDSLNWNITYTNNILVGNSNATIPRYSFNGDVDTGIYSETANTLGFATGGFPRILISAGTSIFYNNVVPDVNNTRSLGTGSFTWDDVFANNVALTSDETKKENIVSSDLGLEFIDQLRPVSYSFIDGNSGRKHYGLIAQEVEDVLTDNNITTANFAALVKEQKKDVNDVPIDNQFDYALRYTEFISPMIKAIQELKAENVAMQAQINDLTDLIQ